MQGIIVATLSAFGFGPFFEQQLDRAAQPDAVPARIAAEHRAGYVVWSSAGAGQAQLAGRLRTELEEQGLPGVGDWVVLRDPPAPDRPTVIDQLLARRTVFTRGAAGKQTRTQVIAANVDLVFAVCGLDADYNLRRIERYLARIWASGAQPAVILNKADLYPDAALRAAEVEGNCPGVAVHVTSALQARGLNALRALVGAGVTAAVVGSSGAGKSTLINALLGEEQLPTGEVRPRDGRGCHVTTHRQLVLLPGGGLLLDTPGMRELQLVDDEGLAAVFEDIAALATRCHYRDCSHDTEPGCAVKAAVESGELAGERLEHFRKLESEAQAFQLRHNEHSRRQSERVWGQLHDEVERLRSWKRGS